MQDLEQNGQPLYLGIDVSKRCLDVHAHPKGQRWQLSNDRAGLAQLIKALAGRQIGGIVFEATGKYHRPLHRALYDAGLPCAMINPRHARHYAKALGIEAKTDALDAHMLALFAMQVQPQSKPPTAENLNQLKELVAARRAAAQSRTAAQNRLGETSLPLLRQLARARIKQLEQQTCRIESAIHTLITSDPALDARYQIILSIPGMGPVNAFTCLAEMPELGSADAKQIAALAGLAPMARDSGLFKGKRCIRGGRKTVRNALYMAALAASKCNPDLKAFYQRLIQKGKPPKSALTAVMRKQIILANTLIAQNRKWTPKMP